MKGQKPEHLPDRLNSIIATRMLEQFEIAAPQMEAEITFEEFKKTFKKWRESTKTSPSGRHLCHYRSLLVPDGTNNEDEIGKQIMRIHYHMTMWAVTAGNPLERW